MLPNPLCAGGGSASVCGNHFLCLCRSPAPAHPSAWQPPASRPPPFNPNFRHGQRRTPLGHVMADGWTKWGVALVHTSLSGLATSLGEPALILTQPNHSSAPPPQQGPQALFCWAQSKIFLAQSAESFENVSNEKNVGVSGGFRCCHICFFFLKIVLLGCCPIQSSPAQLR